MIRNSRGRISLTLLGRRYRYHIVSTSDVLHLKLSAQSEPHDCLKRGYNIRGIKIAYLSFVHSMLQDLSFTDICKVQYILYCIGAIEIENDTKNKIEFHTDDKDLNCG